jgi:putative iron-only hydrogenase system regulator
MENRVAVLALITEDFDSAEQINAILHEYREYIIGRMGVPYREKGVNVISVAIDAPQDKINSLGGKIGRLNGVTAKTLYSANKK